MEVYLGKPSKAIEDWCKAKYPPAPTGTPYVYAGSTSEPDHEHKFIISKLCANKELSCIYGDYVHISDLSYLSSDAGCELTEIEGIAFDVYPQNLTYVNLPTVTTVGYKAFWGQPVTNVILPNATSIEYGIFRDCSSLQQVTVTSLTIEQVRNIDWWSDGSTSSHGVTFHCSDGDVVL